jgi:hypothetical protein
MRTDWHPLQRYNSSASCAVHATPSIASGAASRSEPTRRGAAAACEFEDRPQPLQSVRALARGIAASEDIVNAEEGHHGRDEEETKRRRQEGPAPNLRLRDQHLDLDTYATACWGSMQEHGRNGPQHALAAMRARLTANEQPTHTHSDHSWHAVQDVHRCARKDRR